MQGERSGVIQCDFRFELCPDSLHNLKLLTARVGVHIWQLLILSYIFIIIDCFRCERGVGSCCVLKSGRKSGGGVKTVAL